MLLIKYIKGRSGLSNRGIKMRKIFFTLILTLIVLSSVSCICAVETGPEKIDDPNVLMCTNQNTASLIEEAPCEVNDIDDNSAEVLKDCADVEASEDVVDDSVIVDCDSEIGAVSEIPNCVCVYGDFTCCNLALPPIFPSEGPNNSLPFPGILVDPYSPGMLYPNKKVSCHMEWIKNPTVDEVRGEYCVWKSTIRMRVVDDSGRGVAGYPVVAAHAYGGFKESVKLGLYDYGFFVILYTDGDGYVTYSYRLPTYHDVAYCCMCVNEFDNGIFWSDYGGCICRYY